MIPLRQSTAVVVPMGPFLDKADGFTARTALSSQAGRIVKVGTGAGFTATSWSHDSGGHYLVGLSTAHTDTLGPLRVDFYDAAVHTGVWENFFVLPQAEYDALFAGISVELAAVPPVTSGFAKMLQWCFSVARNLRTSTGAIEKIKKDDGTTDLASAPVSSDGTTTTRNKWS